MGRKTHPRIQRAKGQIAIVALRLIGALPFVINRALATIIGVIVARLPTQALKVSKTNLALCYPALSDAKRAQLARESLIESIKNTFEIALFWRRPAQGLQRVAADRKSHV